MEVEIFLLFVLSQFFSRKKKKKPNFKVCASSMYSLLTDRNLNSRFLTTTRHLLLRRLTWGSRCGSLLTFSCCTWKKICWFSFSRILYQKQKPKWKHSHVPPCTSMTGTRAYTDTGIYLLFQTNLIDACSELHLFSMIASNKGVSSSPQVSHHELQVLGK